MNLWEFVCTYIFYYCCFLCCIVLFYYSNATGLSLIGMCIVLFYRAVPEDLEIKFDYHPTVICVVPECSRNRYGRTRNIKNLFSLSAFVLIFMGTDEKCIFKQRAK